MAYVIGIVLALGVFGFGRWTRFDRDGAFYPTVVVVVAAYYVLFATMSGAERALVVESIVMIGESSPLCFWRVKRESPTYKRKVR